MKECFIQYPDFVEQQFHLPPEAIGEKILQMAALKMYEVGDLSIEQAAVVAGVTQEEFSQICACAAVFTGSRSTPAAGDEVRSNTTLVRAPKKLSWENGRRLNNSCDRPLEGIYVSSEAGIPAILQHPATLEVIELLECQAWQALLEEPTAFQILAHLVVEGLVSVEESRLVITPIGTQHIQNLISTKYAQFLE